MPDTQVLFRIPTDEGDAFVETLWAYELGDDRYRLNDAPFFAYSVSWQDVVFAPYDSHEGFPTFERVVSKSGNRTMRIYFDSPGEESDLIMRELEAKGCSYEKLGPSFVAVMLPAHVSLPGVADYLIEAGVDWEYADPAEHELFPSV